MDQALKFCADVHLGRLARSLRMLGFDTFYQNNISKTDLLETAWKEKRILLSKDIFFKKDNRISFLRIIGSDSSKQLMQVITHFKLKDKVHPFTRCLHCNGRLEPVMFEQIKEVIPPDTARHYNEYFICIGCRRVYWKDSHYDRMSKKIKLMIEDGS